MNRLDLKRERKEESERGQEETCSFDVVVRGRDVRQNQGKREEEGCTPGWVGGSFGKKEEIHGKKKKRRILSKRRRIRKLFSGMVSIEKFTVYDE